MAPAGNALWTVIPTGQQAGGAWIDDTLRQRVEENGLLAKVPLAGCFPRQRVEVVDGDDPTGRLNTLYYLRGWTDGLPIVPPTLGRVREMLNVAPQGPEYCLGEVEPLRGLATIEKVAANAVMAGCRPLYFPVVLAALEATLDPAFNMRGVQTTDENVTPLIVVNGPIARQIGINGGCGALGPGWRANATIGRAIRLVMNNLGGGWPGAVSLAGLGQPGRFTLCLAENESLSPWAPLHTDLGLPATASAVTVMRAESTTNVTGGLEDIASVMGSATSAFSILWSGHSTVILSPPLARALASTGWSKDKVRERLVDQGRWSADQWRRSWLYKTMGDDYRWPAWVRAAAETGAIPAVRAPEDLVLVVAGGNLPIPQHVYCPSWGFPPARVTREIQLPSNWNQLLAETAVEERQP